MSLLHILDSSLIARCMTTSRDTYHSRESPVHVMFVVQSATQQAAEISAQTSVLKQQMNALQSDKVCPL